MDVSQPHWPTGLRAQSAAVSPGEQRLARAAVALREADARLGTAQHDWRRGYLLRRLLFGSDVLALLGAYGVLTVAESATGRTGSVVNLLEFLALVPLWLWLASLAGLYHLSERRVDQSFVDEVGPVAMVTTMWSWCSLIIAAVLSSGETPLFGPIVVWAVTMPIVLIARAVARRVARRSSWFRQPVLLVGDSEDVERVLRRLLRHPELGIDPIASLCKHGAGFVLEQLTKDGPRHVSPDWADSWELSSSDLAQFVTSSGIGRVIVTGWSGGLSERTELIRLLAESGVCVDYVSGEPEALCSTAVLHHIEGLPILTIRLTTSRITLALKRVIDLCVASLGLVLLSPLLVYSAIRVKLQSTGPVLFRQVRTGTDGVPFEVLKLRTMVDGADEMRADLRAQINGNGTNGAKMLKLADDPRVTPFGAWLRRWSIDEVPQLWNVVRGDMSLVGPRPLPLDETRFAEAHFADRVRMRPGITGPWQIHGRSDIPFDDMVKLDYLYVASWTMREDMRLLARTLGVVLRGRGAY